MKEPVKGLAGHCSGQCDTELWQAWSVQVTLAPLFGGTGHLGSGAQLESGEAALSSASGVDNLSLIPVWLMCHFPNSTEKPTSAFSVL